VLLAVAVVTALAASGWLVWSFERTLPDVRQLAANSSVNPICSGGDRGVYVPLAKIPSLIREAAIAVEEPDFYERPSLNPYVEHVLAAFSNRKPRQSGITNTVTRCLISSGSEWERRPNWPIDFALLTNQVARRLSRDRILEIYLNETYLGRSAYGVVTASEVYFGKPLDRLRIDEIAFIVALPKAPTYLAKNKDRVTERRNLVIDRMLEAGIINDNDATDARERPLELREPPSSDAKPQ
jgi:penicillin-binding protein 1A